MLRKIREAQKNEEGFTLIELLVVVLIIGILAAIAIPVFMNQREKAYRNAAESDVRNLALAVEDFASDNNGSYDVDDTAGTAANGPLVFNATEGVLRLEVFAGTTASDGFCIEAEHDAFGTTEIWVYDASTGAANAQVVHDDASPLTADCGTTLTSQGDFA